MNNNSRLFVTAMTGLFAVFATARAQITVVDFGPTDEYVTANQGLIGGNGSFSVSNISPATNYAGPAFWGGIVYNVGGTAPTWAIMDNYGSAGNLDGIRGSRQSMAIGDSATYAFMFSGTETFSIDNTSNSSFFLNARRDGGQNGSNTGIRWILRDTDGDYFVSALDNGSSAQFSGAYDPDGGVTQSSLLGINWFEYTFTTGVVGSQIANNSNFFGSTEFTAAGFHYTASRVTGGGGLDMIFTDFTVVAIPEPSTLALLGIAGLCAGLFARRRR